MGGAFPGLIRIDSQTCHRIAEGACYRRADVEIGQTAREAKGDPRRKPRQSNHAMLFFDCSYEAGRSGTLT